MIRIGTPGFISAVSFDDLVFLSAHHVLPIHVRTLVWALRPWTCSFRLFSEEEVVFVFCRNFRQTVVY